MKNKPDPKPAGSSPSAGRARFIIQIERPGQKLQMDDVTELFRETGVELDANYGPILVNPGLGRFVVRGLADALARERAEALPGVKLFSDARIKPTRQGHPR